MDFYFIILFYTH